jgi:hypothetical protein
MWYTLTLAIGIILLAISLLKLKESLTFLRTSERAVGTVIELEKIAGSDGGHTFKPIFKFKTISNQEIIYRHISSGIRLIGKLEKRLLLYMTPTILQLRDY